MSKKEKNKLIKSVTVDNNQVYLNMLDEIDILRKRLEELVAKERTQPKIDNY